MLAPNVSGEKKNELKIRFSSMNPFELKRGLEKKLDLFFSLVKRTSSRLPIASSRFPVDKAAVRRATKPYSNIRCGSEANENAVYGEYRRCTVKQAGAEKKAA
jgi:hypothetical protein